MQIDPTTLCPLPLHPFLEALPTSPIPPICPLPESALPAMNRSSTLFTNALGHPKTEPESSQFFAIATCAALFFVCRSLCNRVCRKSQPPMNFPSTPPIQENQSPPVSSASSEHKTPPTSELAHTSARDAKQTFEQALRALDPESLQKPRTLSDESRFGCVTSESLGDLLEALPKSSDAAFLPPPLVFEKKDFLSVAQALARAVTSSPYLCAASHEDFLEKLAGAIRGPSPSSKLDALYQDRLRKPDLLPDMLIDTYVFFKWLHEAPPSSDRDSYQKLTLLLGRALSPAAVKPQNPSLRNPLQWALEDFVYLLYTKIPFQPDRAIAIPQLLLQRKYVHLQEERDAALSTISFKWPETLNEKAIFKTFLDRLEKKEERILFPCHLPAGLTDPALQDLGCEREGVFYPLFLSFDPKILSGGSESKTTFLRDIRNQLKLLGLDDATLKEDLEKLFDQVHSRYFRSVRTIFFDQRARNGFLMQFYSHLKEFIALRNRISFLILPEASDSFYYSQFHVIDLMRKMLEEGRHQDPKKRRSYLQTLNDTTRQHPQHNFLTAGLSALLDIPADQSARWEFNAWRLEKPAKKEKKGGLF